MTPLVSVLLVTRDGMATLPAVLAQVAAQRGDFAFEVVAVDSGSRDGTVELLAECTHRVVHIDPGQFNHGATRNLGIAACRGELVVLLVQDALPAGADWLASLCAPLLADGGLAGTYARQEPRPEASALTRFYLERWAATASVPRLQRIEGAAAFAALPPARRLELCTFDDVCSCVRRAAWERIPFRPVPIAEDVAWAHDVLLAGWQLRYTPEAVVYHSHDRPALHALRRERATHERLSSLLGLRTIPSLPALAKAWAWALQAHWRVAVRRPRELPRALALAITLPLGQYLGGRAGAAAEA